MAITETSILQPGTRVRVQRGRLPADSSRLGRSGMVVANSQYYPHKVEVVLDGDPRIRAFAPDELEVMAAAELLPPDKAAARQRLSRP